MSREDLPLIPRPELAELLYYLGEKDSQGALLLGDAGIGKTTLLRIVEEELKRQGRAVFYTAILPYVPQELGTMVLHTVATSPFNDVSDIGRTLRTSAGEPPLSEVGAILRDIGGQMSSPVLVIDSFDYFADPDRKAAEVEELTLTLPNWKFVVSSRTTGALIRRLSHFRVIQLRGFSDDEATTLLREYAPELSDEEISRIVDRSAGNPLFLTELVQALRENGSDRSGLSIPPTIAALIEQRVNRVISSSSEPAKLGMLLEELALAGGRDEISALALKSGITEDEVRRLLYAPAAGGLIVLDDSSRTATIRHALIREGILSRILPSGLRLADLKFGAEEAERDELLDESFVRRRGMGAIFDQHRSIVVGDRGSGKSAIFRKLAAGTSAADVHRRSEICPVTNTGDLLHRIVAGDAWLDADALRAAWLVVVASVVASTVPASAPRKLRRDAADLRAAFGLSTEATSPASHMLRTVFGLFGGTTLNFAVGPVNLQAKLPSGNGRPSRASVDVESFLQEADSLLRESARRVAVMFDRIDETFRYDRAKQEAVVQSLLQAEGRVSLLECIELVVFLRTDFFELYDIQEKNKLVSRTITLDWSEEEWLQVLVRRVFANEPFQRLATRLRDTDGAIETRSALEVLFPPEVEGQPIDRWLIDSLRNGNGDVSPRLAILLLYISRDMSANPEGVVSTLPLFSAEVAGKAMTKLSDLSFSEFVNDFKVAPSFVLNVRAGKLYDFSMHDVENLFSEAEGKISEQVRLLERLGFLERVVQESSSGAKSLFRIPKLYTRCWEHS
jgi:hypothetical protein